MTTLSLHATANLSARYRPALATLPVTFAPGGTAIAVIDGQCPDWPDLVRTASSTGLVLLSDPILATVDGDVPRGVVVDLPWFGSHVARDVGHLEDTEADLIDVALVLGKTDDRTLPDAIVDALSAVARLVDGPLDLEILAETETNALIVGEASATTLSVSAVKAPYAVGGATVAVRGRASSLELRLPAPGAGWAGTIVTTGIDGMRIAPPVESDHRRATLVALAAAVGGRLPDELRFFAQAAGAVAAARRA